MAEAPPPGGERTFGQMESITDLASPEFVAALLVDGDDDLAAWVIGQALEGRTRAEVFDGVIRPAMELVGDRWEAGEWSVSQEHLATVALTAALARLRPSDAASTRVGPVAVLAAPEGEQHVSGLVCLAQILEERGWRVENLGANVPADDLRGFVAQRDVDLVGLSVGSAERLPALNRTIGLLRATGPDTPIMVGGYGIAGTEGDVEGATVVTSSLIDAARFVEDIGRQIGERANERTNE